MSAATYCFELDFGVRDYECDVQGVVNNAVYFNYLEHTRHQYLKHLGLDFAALHRQGHDLVLLRCELDYRAPLRSGDAFVVRLAPRRQSRLRIVFLQDIFRRPDEILSLRARSVCTCLTAGRPSLPEVIAAKFAGLEPE